MLQIDIPGRRKRFKKRRPPLAQGRRQFGEQESPKWHKGLPFRTWSGIIYDDDDGDKTEEAIHRIKGLVNANPDDGVAGQRVCPAARVRRRCPLGDDGSRATSNVPVSAHGAVKTVKDSPPRQSARAHSMTRLGPPSPFGAGRAQRCCARPEADVFTELRHPTPAIVGSYPGNPFQRTRVGPGPGCQSRRPASKARRRSSTVAAPQH